MSEDRAKHIRTGPPKSTVVRTGDQLDGAQVRPLSAEGPQPTAQKGGAELRDVEGQTITNNTPKRQSAPAGRSTWREQVETPKVASMIPVDGRDEGVAPTQPPADHSQPTNARRLAVEDGPGVRWEKTKVAAKKTWNLLTEADFAQAEGSIDTLYDIIHDKVGGRWDEIKHRLEHLLA